MVTSRLSLKDQLDELDKEIQAEENALWGSAARGVDLTTSPTFLEIVRVLQNQPLLVAPVLKWLRIKQAEMARAQLGVLYTPEELEQMYAEANSK